MHSTNNYSKYFTVGVDYASSENMNAAITIEISVFTNHHVVHIKHEHVHR
jgi:hypothetical protein